MCHMWMTGVLGHDSALVRLYSTGANEMNFVMNHAQVSYVSNFHFLDGSRIHDLIRWHVLIVPNKIDYIVWFDIANYSNIGD